MYSECIDLYDSSIEHFRDLLASWGRLFCRRSPETSKKNQNGLIFVAPVCRDRKADVASSWNRDMLFSMTAHGNFLLLNWQSSCYLAARVQASIE